MPDLASQSAFLHVLSLLLGALPTSTGFVGLATVAAAGVLMALLVTRHVDPDPIHAAIRVRAIALRERSRHSAHLRLRDPDAPGRTRARAPGFPATAH
jgi:hypothetical protein